MSERIKELAKQAGNKRINDYYTNGTVTAFSDEQLQKFAELIVHECADLPVEEPKREWVDLTDDEIQTILKEWAGNQMTVREMLREAEAKLKELNT